MEKTEIFPVKCKKTRSDGMWSKKITIPENLENIIYSMFLYLAIGGMGD
jgi:hypothetical protein